MLFKCFLHRITKQKLISSLMIANTAIAAFVICFSYGVFQNYRSKINEGEQQGKMVYISALYSTSEQHPYKDFNEKNDII